MSTLPIAIMTYRNLQSALVYFAFTMGIGFAFGCLRVLFLVPRLGQRYAELIEMPFMLVAIVVAAKYVTHRTEPAPTLAIRFQIGFAALALSLVTELVLATVLQDRSITSYILSRDPVSGSAYLFTMLLFALMPAILRGRADALC